MWGHVKGMEKERNAYTRILVGKPERDHWEDKNLGGGWTLL
jgi:hypothetical protein